MKTTIYCIRHAETLKDKNRASDDWDLTPEGILASEKIAEQLVRVPLSAIYTSPYKKSLLTITPLSKSLNLNYIIENDLRERHVTDSYLNDFYKVIEDSWKDFHWALPDGESYFFAQERVTRTVKKLADLHLGETIAIASHGQLLALLFNFFDKSFGFEEWKKMRMPDIFSIDVCNDQIDWSDTDPL